MNLTIAPCDVRANLLDNPELDIAKPIDFLQQLLEENALPSACVGAIEGAVMLLDAAQAQLEAAARIADGLAG